MEISFDSSFLRRGVVLVDTPGIGSTHLKNTLVTYDFLSRIDAAIFVLSVDPPISQAEVEFLREVRNQVDRIFFVQNKIDYVTDEDKLEALRFSESIIENALENLQVGLYPISAKLALSARLSRDEEQLLRSGLISLESDLDSFLATVRGEEIIRQASKRALRVISDIRMAIEVEQRILEEPIFETERKLRWLKEEMERVGSRIDELDYLIDGHVEKIMQEFDVSLGEHKRSSENELLSNLRGFLEGIDTRLGPREFVELVQDYIASAIVEDYKSYITEQESRILRAFGTMVLRLDNEVNEMSNRLRQEISDVFGTKVHTCHNTTVSIERTRFHFDDVVLLNYETILPAELPFLLPKPLYRKAMRKRALEILMNEYDKHGGKIRYDFAYRLSEGARHLKSEMRSRMLLTLETIRSGVISGQDFMAAAMLRKQSRIAQLQAANQEVEEISQELRVMVSPRPASVHDVDSAVSGAHGTG
jgi:hypothetical protein